VHAAAATTKIRAEREYRALVIDSLVVMHELCYSRHYAKARDVATQLRPPLDFKSRLLRRYPRLARSAPGCALQVLIS